MYVSKSTNVINHLFSLFQVQLKVEIKKTCLKFHSFFLVLITDFTKIKPSEHLTEAYTVCSPFDNVSRYTINYIVSNLAREHN